MFRSFSLLSLCLLAVTSLTPTQFCHAQPQQVSPREIPEALRPWQDWATWDDRQVDCPPQYNAADKRICFWPSRLTLAAAQSQATFNIGVRVFSETLGAASRQW